jgi:hypothetical protein
MPASRAASGAFSILMVTGVDSFCGSSVQLSDVNEAAFDLAQISPAFF